MSHWVVRKLSSVLRIQNGFAFDSKQFSPDGEMPLIRIRDLKNGVVTETNFSGEFDSRYVVRAGDFLIGMDGEFGCYEWRGPDALLNQRVCKLTDFAAGIEPRFLFYGINKYLKHIEDRTTFTTVKHISSKQIAEIEFPFPPIEEQRRIVAVLDEAFAVIATATANAETNVANARKLFQASLSRAFHLDDTGSGGIAAPDAWEQVTLGELCHVARGGSPRPIRNFLTSAPEGINWIKIGDATAGDGKYIATTKEKIRPEGLKMSRLVKPGDFLLSNSMSFGRPYIMRTTGCIHDGWLVLRDKSHRFDPDYLYYFLSSDAAYRQFDALAAGSTVRNLNTDLVKTVTVALPPLEVQRQLIEKLEELSTLLNEFRVAQQSRLKEMDALKQALLDRAFAGELTERKTATPVPTNDDFATPEFAAQVLAFAHSRHVASGRVANFGHVKAQKTLQAVEAVGGLELGRQPMKDAAGPNDFAHMRQAEDWARQQGFFEFALRTNGGYNFRQLHNYGKLLDEANRRMQQAPAVAKRAVELLVDMDSDWAEIVMTTYAAWNNLILDQAAITDDAIVHAARDDWHRDKLRYDKSRFHDAIRFMRQNGIEPDGSAKRVGGQESLPL